MKVQRAEESAGPGYPDLKEVLINRHLLGAAALGAGVMISACAPPPRTGGTPIPHSGNTVPVDPAHSAANNPKDPDKHHHPPPVPKPKKNLVTPEEQNPPPRMPRLGGVPPRR